MRHIDQYRVNFYSDHVYDDPFRRIDEPFADFPGVYEHTYNNGQVVTTVPHEDGRCEDALKTCGGKCEREARNVPLHGKESK